MHLLSDTHIGSNTVEGYIPLSLYIIDNAFESLIECRYYKTEPQLNKSAVIFVGGVGGGWDSPSKGLYPKLAYKLVKDYNTYDDGKINSLRIKFRYPTDLEKSVMDVMAGIEFLTQKEKISSIGLVGHSFGGAVVVSSAAKVISDPFYNNAIKTVVTLSTQSYGTEGVPKLKEGKCSILLIHGNSDDVLPPYCSSYVYKKAKEPKQLVLYDNAGHGLDEVSEKVFKKLQKWFVENLNKK